MKKQQTLLITLSAGILALGMAGGTDAALVGRLPATPGGTDYQAYYDDATNLTWLADANYAQTSGYDADGLMHWQAANAWAAQLTVAGVGGWRLPTSDITCFGLFCGGGEMGQLYYGTLGNTANYLTNTWGPFSNVSNRYWYATEYAFDVRTAWSFDMGSGWQDYYHSKTNSFAGWAVQTGNVSGVPVPAAVWLFGSGLLGLIGVARHKKEKGS